MNYKCHIIYIYEPRASLKIILCLYNLNYNNATICLVQETRDKLPL